jgi:hypothetical protein
MSSASMQSPVLNPLQIWIGFPVSTPCTRLADLHSDPGFPFSPLQIGNSYVNDTAFGLVLGFFMSFGSMQLLVFVTPSQILTGAPVSSPLI